jgi:hypothetical protein
LRSNVFSNQKSEKQDEEWGALYVKKEKLTQNDWSKIMPNLRHQIAIHLESVKYDVGDFFSKYFSF